MSSELPDSVEERLARIEEEFKNFQAEERRKISRNTVGITLTRYTLIVFLGGVGFFAALLSGANYETKIGDSSVSFHGDDFKESLQILAGIAATGTGVLGFGERLLKAKEDD